MKCLVFTLVICCLNVSPSYADGVADFFASQNHATFVRPNIHGGYNFYNRNGLAGRSYGNTGQQRYSNRSGNLFYARPSKSGGSNLFYSRGKK